MTFVAPTTKDVSRAIAALDENASAALVDPVHDDWMGQTTMGEIVNRVSRQLAYQFNKHNGWGGRGKVKTSDVRAALITHGASTLTVELFARTIASRIRGDFSDGRGEA